MAGTPADAGRTVWRHCRESASKREFIGIIWVVVKIMVPFLGTLNIRGRIIVGTQKGTIILTTTHMRVK